MRIKSVFAALLFFLSPMAVGATTININANGTLFSTDAGTVSGPVGDVGFSVAAKALDTSLYGLLETRIEVLFGDGGGTATVETLANYTDFASIITPPSINVGSRANVSDIASEVPIVDPVRGSVRVEHFITLLGGTEIALSDFLFNERTDDKKDIDNIAYLGQSFQLRSLFTFEADRRAAAGTVGQIVVVDGKTVPQFPPVPIPASILLMGTALVGFGVIRRKATKAT